MLSQILLKLKNFHGRENFSIFTALMSIVTVFNDFLHQPLAQRGSGPIQLTLRGGLSGLQRSLRYAGPRTLRLLGVKPL